MSVSEDTARFVCKDAALPLGATPEEWLHFHTHLGLTHDLYPVVCNTEAEFSPRSALKSVNIGRVPCMYDEQGQVVGFPGWPGKLSSAHQVERWMSEPDYGICLVTREVRGLDIDVTDAQLADEIAEAIEQKLGLKLPTRCRQGVSKRLLAVRVGGTIAKRKLIVTNNEKIEFLGTGQQFVAAGTRDDRSRYYWDGGLPEAFPTISEDELNRLWSVLEERFGVAPSASSSVSTERREHSAERVGYPEHQLADMLKSIDPEQGYDQWLKIGMALHHETYGEGFALWDEWSANGASYEGSEHLQSKWDGFGRQAAPGVTIRSIIRAAREAGAVVGGPVASPDDFPFIEDTPEEITEKARRKSRFEVIPIGEFSRRPPPEYLVEDLLPMADLAVVFGASGSGKSFVVTDMAIAIARGIPWRGLEVKQGRVVYIAAEGGGGYSQRAKAYGIHHQIDLDGVPFGVIHAAPNLLQRDDLTEVIERVKAFGGADLVVIDTLAQATPGANENGAEDMGLAVKNARAIGEAAGGMALLVHHTGKDAAKGARGWSGLRAAADTELEVIRSDNGTRFLQVTKQKDGRDDGRWGFALMDVVVGFKRNGKPITSCVVVEADAPEIGRASRAKDGVKYGRLEQLLLETFTELQLGGEVKRSDLLLGAFKKDTRPGSARDRKKNFNQSLKGLARPGKKQVFILGDDYVTEVEK